MINIPIALLCGSLWMVAASGFYEEKYLKTTTTYCPFDGTPKVGCIKSGIMPWGMFSDCWKNVTSYAASDELFSCRLCTATSTCSDSNPEDSYLLDQERTELGALGYLFCALAQVRRAGGLPRTAFAHALDAADLWGAIGSLLGKDV